MSTRIAVGVVASAVLLGGTTHAGTIADHLDFLSKEGRSSGRQASLRSALDWGFDRLSPANQKLLTDLTVFRGGFTLASLRAVLAGTPAFADLATRAGELVTALGDSVKQAQRLAYGAAAEIRFAGMQYRRDIGHQAVAARPAPRGASPPR